MTKKRRRINFSLEAPEASEVYLAGDFNSWNPKKKPLKKKNGQWTGILMLQPGEYQYKYVIDSNWEIDPGADVVDNGLGTQNNNIIVNAK